MGPRISLCTELLAGSVAITTAGRKQRARLFEGPDADETTVSYISDGMVIIEHLSARTGDIIRTCKNFTFSTVKSTHRRPSNAVQRLILGSTGESAYGTY